MKKVHFYTNKFQEYLKQENVEHIITRSHSAFAERAIKDDKDDDL
jgi:hypothetical protein